MVCRCIFFFVLFFWSVCVQSNHLPRAPGLFFFISVTVTVKNVWFSYCKTNTMHWEVKQCICISFWSAAGYMTLHSINIHSCLNKINSWICKKLKQWSYYSRQRKNHSWEEYSFKTSPRVIKIVEKDIFILWSLSGQTWNVHTLPTLNQLFNLFWPTKTSLLQNRITLNEAFRKRAAIQSEFNPFQLNQK